MMYGVSSRVLWVYGCFVFLSLAIRASGNLSEHTISNACIANTHERLYVSTVDGTLTALDASGSQLWSYSSREPLFKSTLSYSEASEAVPNLIPGLDRALYHWDGSKLQTLPYSADDLIDSDAFSIGESGTLAGCKEREVVGINVQNGRPLYECTASNCHRYDNNSLIQNVDVLKVSTSRVTVREANEITGEELWNFTVGEFHLFLVEGAQDEKEDFSCQTSAHIPWDLQVDTITGVLSAIDWTSNAAVWKRKFSAPIVSVWLHKGGRLERINLLTQQQVTSDLNYPSLMLVYYKSQYYIQPVIRDAQRDDRGLTINEGGSVKRVSSCSTQSRGDEELVNQLVDMYYAETFYLFKPSNIESSSESEMEYETGTHALTLYPEINHFQEMCTTGPNGDIDCAHCRQFIMWYEFDRSQIYLEDLHHTIAGATGLAVYFYLDIECYYRDCGSGEENGSTGEGEACALPASDPSGSLSVSQPGGAGWLVSTAWSTVKYVLFALFVLGLSHVRRYHHLQRRTSSDEDEFPVWNLTLDRPRRNSSSVKTLSPNTSTETLVNSIESQKRLELIAESRVIPRFDSDYEVKGHLGKGGFGVVYHVQNKTDGGEYAIKRIKLPTNKSAKEKVMREVQALAQLDHTMIVRYFHSWVEKAPAGWNQMKEWMPLSNKTSFGGEHSCQPSEVPIESICPSDPLSAEPSSSPVSVSYNNPSLVFTHLAPCPSFNSLDHSAIHSVIPPIRQLNTDSRSSSFVIEFAEDNHAMNGSHKLNGSGCFSRDLLQNRDDLSVGSSCSESTDDRINEQRDSVCDLVEEPPTYLFIQMQLCQKETLKDWLTKNVHNRKKETVMHFFQQTLEAVLYVHQKGMMHRDLKPSNIFFSLNGQVKVGDFGLVTGSAFTGYGNSYLALQTLGEDHKQHTGNIGSHFYISPELMSCVKYNNKVDIFSLGVIFFELHYPFSTQMERVKELDNLRNKKFPPRFKTHLRLEADFVEWLMNPIASQRPSAKEVAGSEQLRILRENISQAEVNLIPKL